MELNDCTVRIRQVSKIIDVIFQKINNTYGNEFHVIYDPHIRIGNGDNRFKSLNEVWISLGCSEHFKSHNKKIYFGASIPIIEFSKMLIAAYHETRHVLQYEQFYESTLANNATIKKMAIQSTAICNNDFFYHTDYCNNICEIDAERYGLRNARNTLSEMYGQDIADELILAHVREALRQPHHVPPYFGITYSNNVDDILASFDERFNELLLTKPLFLYTAPNTEDYQKENDLFYSQVVNKPYNQQLYKYDNITDGWSQMYLMCAVNNQYAHALTPIEKGHILENELFLDYCDMCQREADYGKQYFSEHKELQEPEKLISKNGIEDLNTFIREAKAKTKTQAVPQSLDFDR